MDVPVEAARPPVQIYLSQNVTGGRGRVACRSARWAYELHPVGTINSRYIDKLADVRAGVAEEPSAQEVWKMRFEDICKADLLVADMRGEGAEYGGLLIEMGLAQALGIPVFVVANPSVDVAWRSMVRGYPNVSMCCSISVAVCQIEEYVTGTPCIAMAGNSLSNNDEANDLIARDNEAKRKRARDRGAAKPKC